MPPGGRRCRAHPLAARRPARASRTPIREPKRRCCQRAIEPLPIASCGLTQRPRWPQSWLSSHGRHTVRWVAAADASEALAPPLPAPVRLPVRGTVELLLASLNNLRWCVAGAEAPPGTPRNLAAVRRDSAGRPGCSTRQGSEAALCERSESGVSRSPAHGDRESAKRRMLPSFSAITVDQVLRFAQNSGMLAQVGLLVWAQLSPPIVRKPFLRGPPRSPEARWCSAYRGSNATILLQIEISCLR
jgi:hypothetical protein